MSDRRHESYGRPDGARPGSRLPEAQAGRPGPQRPFGGPMGGPGRGRRMLMPGEKPKDFRGTLKRLIKYLWPRRWQLATVFFFAALSTVFSILSPKVMGKATTKLLEGVMMKMAGVPGASIDFEYIRNVLLTLVALYALSTLFNYIQHFVMAGVAQSTVYQMRKDVMAKLSRLPLKYFDSRTHGEILSRVVNDVDMVSSTLPQSLTQLITASVTLVGTAVMMLSISPLLTLITVVTLPLSVLVTMGVAKRSQGYFMGQARTLGELNGHVEEMYTGHKLVKAFGRESQSIQAFKEINERLYENGWRAQFMASIMFPLMGFVNNLGYVIVSVAGGLLVMRQAIAIGDIQAFINYSRQFTQPISQTANIANIIQSTVASAERVFEVLDEAEEAPDKEDAPVLQDVKGLVEFKDVRFRYKEDVPLIENLSITAKPGQTIAIVGPTGAGKTTLVNLLMRFYEVNDGVIALDGYNITELRRGDLRTKFGMVLQDTWLFNGTIRDNIAYGRPGATMEEIVAAAKTARADHFIRTLPEGYETVLNEEASNISQGQMQLLTIARAVLADPAILILDEATSSVDTRTELLVQEAMQELMKGRTSFVIAHRLSTVRNADLILVMDNGTIVEQGKHHELLAKGGFYAELYNSQFYGREREKRAG
ncbi:MAG TPA: ABC transporter ATP-binding protein [Firmicutes bacterium]|nr:ABC transporter ATP-binding protein [Candidatus Fermentithermobacillaceae bacterium]